MDDRRDYYYDPESCRFVPRRSSPFGDWKRLGGWALGIIALTSLVLVVMNYTIDTPEELALEAENEMLSSQLSEARQQMQTFSRRLDSLSQRDQRLYRTLLQTQPIPEDLRKAGVGGSETQPSYAHADASTANLLRETGSLMDELERQITLQNASYRELLNLASDRSDWLDQMPAILPANGSVVSGYGMRRHPIYKTRRMHEGIDLITRIGTPVYATGSGIIDFAGAEPGYGKHVRIRHPETGYETLYAHLSRIPDEIDEGARVDRGELVGYSGTSGVSTGPHLHYEVIGENDDRIDPIHFFAPDMTPRQYERARAKAQKATPSMD